VNTADWVPGSTGMKKEPLLPAGFVL
jgi:hypothetical protein